MSISSPELTAATGWEEKANCRGAASEELFGPEDEGTKARRVRELEIIKTYCLSCEVSTDCLNTALVEGRSEGVWGGTTERDRRTYNEGELSYIDLAERHMDLDKDPRPLVKVAPVKIAPALKPIIPKSENSEKPVTFSDRNAIPRINRQIGLGFRMDMPELSDTATVGAILGHDSNAWLPAVTYAADKLLALLLEGKKPNNVARGVVFLLKANNALQPLQPNKKLDQKITDVLTEYIKLEQPQIETLVQPLVVRAQTLTEEDLAQAATIGLLRGLSRFDLGRDDAKVSTFFEHGVLGSALDTFRDHDRIIRVSRRDTKLASDYSAMIADGKTHEQAVKELSQEREDVEDILTKIDQAKTVSLDELIAREGEPGLLFDGMSIDPEEIVLSPIADAQHVAQMLKKLTDRERYLIEQYFGLGGMEPKTLAEIGDELGLTESRMCQVKATAFKKLRERFDDI